MTDPWVFVGVSLTVVGVGLLVGPCSSWCRGRSDDGN